MTTVRTARPEDAEAIAWIHVAGWRHAYARLMPAAYLAGLDADMPHRVARQRHQITGPMPRTACLVAIQPDSALGPDARVVGFAYAGPYRNNQSVDDLSESVGEVYAIYVEPDRIGTGAGRALMDAAVRWLGEHGLDPIQLWVLEQNLLARAFYQRYGFRPDGGRSTLVLEQPGELPVELTEVRLTFGG